jgi:hypothetical protein
VCVCEGYNFCILKPFGGRIEEQRLSSIYECVADIIFSPCNSWMPMYVCMMASCETVTVVRYA